jgi:hypothetical protein
MRISLHLLRKAMDASVDGAQPSLPRLDYPLFPVPRIAVLGVAVEAAASTHVLESWDAAALNELKPMALAGSWTDLQAVAQLVMSGALELGELRYPIVVFSSPESGPLSDDGHAQLWEWFHVPTYDQIRAGAGELLATECESRAGFHLAEGVDPARLNGVALDVPCGCGSTRKLYRVEPLRGMSAAL